MLRIPAGSLLDRARRVFFWRFTLIFFWRFTLCFCGWYTFSSPLLSATADSRDVRSISNYPAIAKFMLEPISSLRACASPSKRACEGMHPLPAGRNVACTRPVLAATRTRAMMRQVLRHSPNICTALLLPLTLECSDGSFRPCAAKSAIPCDRGNRAGLAHLRRDVARIYSPASDAPAHGVYGYRPGGQHLRRTGAALP